MFGSAKQSSAKPTAFGSLLQSSCYGNAIPKIYGMTQTTLMAIWAANLRQGPSNKKLKNFFAAKKSGPEYVENIDFLVGHNPIYGIGQLWNNGSLYPLTIVKVSQSLGPTFTPYIDIVDDNFYMVIGVTLTLPYSVTFNDYGGTGPVTASGNFDMPMWNSVETGPNPTRPNAYSKAPFTFRWSPSYGNRVWIDSWEWGTLPSSRGDLNIYYFQFMEATSYESPLAKNRLAFEPQLGSGDEYDGYSSQQIIYPMYAGVGSQNIDLGTTGTLPSLQVETKASFGTYATGDADFADMIEDIIRSGLAQAAIGDSTSPTTTPLEHGLSGYEFPGMIQQQLYQGADPINNDPQPFWQNVTEGNFLVVIAACVLSSSISISDSMGNTYTPLLSPSTGVVSGNSVTQVWVAPVNSSGANTITVSGLGNDWTYVMMEISGVDTIDQIVVNYSGGPLAVTTTNLKGFPAYLLSIFLYEQPVSDITAVVPRWDQVVFGDGFSYAFEYRNWNPGSYNIPVPAFYPTTQPVVNVVLTFKCVNPAQYPKPVGNYIDDDSLDLVRTQCRAYGLYGSLNMSSQSSATEWLKQLLQAANCVAGFEGFKLRFFPLAEQSTAGNGVVYTSPTASGPVAFLTDSNGDFKENDKDLVALDTVDRSELDNVLKMQCYSRSSNYNQVTVEQPEASAIALYGVREADPVVNNAVQDATIARSLLGVMTRRQQLGGDTYSFNLSARWDWIGLMDLIEITDELANIIGEPVRITSMEEQDDKGWTVVAEPFIYGMSSPTPLITTTPVPSGGGGNANASAGNVNSPIIFEPVARLLANTNQPQIWIGVSSSSLIYGGCEILISTDGGASYQTLGTLTGSATTGVSTADWPAAADPDTTNNLALDLTESNGELVDYTTAEENNFGYPSYIAGGTTAIPYELMAYGTATLTSTSKYTLQATGSGNQLRRAVFGAPTTGEGVDHPSGSRFLFLNPAGIGILKVNLQPQWIGTTLYFKILSYNNLGGGLQDPSTVTVYTYTPTGVAVTAPTSYTQTPAIALSQPTATTIHMLQVSVAFPTNTVNYNARTFTITAPSSPTWYYVTIADPGYIGDTGSADTLTASCSTSSANVGVAGQTFIGAILALPGGGATVIIPGGQPTPQLFLVNGN